MGLGIIGSSFCLLTCVKKKAEPFKPLLVRSQNSCTQNRDKCSEIVLLFHLTTIVNALGMVALSFRCLTLVQEMQNCWNPYCEAGMGVSGGKRTVK